MIYSSLGRKMFHLGLSKCTLDTIIYRSTSKGTKTAVIMTNWKNLRTNPPTEDCNVCVKIGDNYETYRFIAYTGYSWGLYKYPRTYGPDKVSKNAQYINLDEIK